MLPGDHWISVLSGVPGLGGGGLRTPGERVAGAGRQPRHGQLGQPVEGGERCGAVVGETAGDEGRAGVPGQVVAVTRASPVNSRYGSMERSGFAWRMELRGPSARIAASDS
jgi:hypothetical protein